MKFFKKILKSYLNNHGYYIERKPKPLIKNPEFELQPIFDHIISYHLLTKDNFFFIQIGALDGVTYDPIYKYVKRFNWQGILVEPQEKFFQLLKDNYQENNNLTFKKSAISNKSESKILYKVRDTGENLPNWIIGLASFRLETILSHSELIPNLENLIDEEIVECITLDDLFGEIPNKKLDLLQIDVEGYDAEIIKMINFDLYKPSIIHFEHGHLSEKDLNHCLDILINQKYKIAIEKNDTTAYLKDS